MSERLTPKSPRESMTHQEHLVRPQHTNQLGTAFGGEVMSWVDLVAAGCASRHCGKNVVTASIDSLHFRSPIPMGWLALLDARINFAWKTSCEVEVVVQGYQPVTGERRITADAFLTFVALGSDGKPVDIPPVLIDDEESRMRAQEAEERRKIRLSLKSSRR